MSGPPPPPRPREANTLPPPWIQIVDTECGSQLKCFLCCKVVSEDHFRNKKHLQCEQKPSQNGWKGVYLPSTYGHVETAYDVGREVTEADMQLPCMQEFKAIATIPTSGSSSPSYKNPQLSRMESDHLTTAQQEEQQRENYDKLQEELLALARAPEPRGQYLNTHPDLFYHGAPAIDPLRVFSTHAQQPLQQTHQLAHAQQQPALQQAHPLAYAHQQYQQPHQLAPVHQQYQQPHQLYLHQQQQLLAQNQLQRAPLPPQQQQ